MKRILFLLLLLGILLRIAILPTYFNSDVVAQGEWAKWLGEHGTKDFYEQNRGFVERPNYPPLINLWYLFIPNIQESTSLAFTNIGLFIALNKLGASYIPWYYDFVQWYGSETLNTREQNSIRYGVLMIVKLLPVLADLLTAGLVYFVAKLFNPKNIIFYLAFYLLFPFSFYVSAYWGQTDPISALFLFLAFLTLHKRRFTLSSLFLTISLSVKPTSLLLTPLFIFYFFYLKPSFKAVFLSITAPITLFLISLSFFTSNNLIFYTQKLYHIFFLLKPTYLNVSALNFWFIFSEFSKISDQVIYFLLPAKIWGFIIMLVLNLITFKLIRQKNLISVFASIFIVGFGSWLFLTNMYERYLFNGILALFFLSVLEKKYLKYFLILGSISLLNMLQGPLAPPQVIDILEANNRIVSKCLAFLNIIVFFWILYLMRIIQIPKRLTKLV